MITTEAYFENIRSVIKSELLAANNNVFAAIAWFTDKTLFDALLQIAQKGVSVQLCVINDAINFGMGKLPFSGLDNCSGKFFSASSDKMHHKFCVIDENVVITGSYNWTARAARDKNENITITTGDHNLAISFINEFYKITNQRGAYVPEVDISRLIKRCNAILQLVMLDEIEDIHRQAKRMENEGGSIPEILEIAQLLLNNKLEQAVDKINSFISEYQRLQTYIDPKIDAVQFEIRLLEYQIIAVENEKAEVEKKVTEYDYLYNEILGETIREYLLIKKKLANHKHKATPNSDTSKRAYEEAEKDYKDYNQSYKKSKEKNKQFKNISEQEKSILKKLYREASMLCHPDKFANEPEKYVKAEAIFKELNNANANQDIERVREITEQLKNGYFETTISEAKKQDAEQLKSQLIKLQKRYEELIEELVFIKQSKAYKTTQEQLNLKDYFSHLKSDIELQILDLKKELQEYE